MLVHVRRHSAVSYAEMAESIKMPFGLWTQMGPNKHVSHGVHVGVIWRIGLNRLCGSTAAFCKITLITCFRLMFTM